MESSIKSIDSIGNQDYSIGGLLYTQIEEHMTNSTLTATDNNQNKVNNTEFLSSEFTSSKEEYVQRGLVTKEKHLGFALDYIQKFESTDFCETVFGNSSSDLEAYSNYSLHEKEGVFHKPTVQECEKQGHAQQGLESLLQGVYLKVQQVNVEFDAAGEAGIRTYAFLKSQLSSDIANMTDVYYVFCCN
eukprot:CAMPEP_0202961788 /NCGR_PEP_ID=MMETSP1396-20130829/5866_1 /ASSEMBLY_ACC=CAM_ASM_000872 /TAXON_ID= /ORGANISM="Pseudokeronopsis sp., Strain Brazil" /LENGTH=187 /DNA_ID=CAMNT_0049681883 /DNA_START=1399 /DNA_END=1962 /DNA_ORIENTATION=-